MSFYSRLFRHINGLWLRNLYQMSVAGTKCRMANLLYRQVAARLPDGETPNLWKEGYLIGHAIDTHYNSTGVFELPDFSGVPLLKGAGDEEYIEFLCQNIHAWAVPLSYHYLLEGAGATLDKSLNLWGSTKSHQRYFGALTEMAVNHLRQAESALPAGVVDIGCGDGSLLRYLKADLEKSFDKTFMFIGFDLDDQSVRIATEKNREGIVFLKGDVAKPEELNSNLISLGYPSLDQFFQVRAFVDHNCKPFFGEECKETSLNAFDYCYIHNNAPVPQEVVEDSFSAHFARWKPFIQRHGLGIIELHKSMDYCLAESPAIAYEIFHLLSEQYVMSYPKYAEMWRNAGSALLDKKSIPNHGSSPNVSISIYQ